jgi:hypothetical protein
MRGGVEARGRLHLGRHDPRRAQPSAGRRLQRRQRARAAPRRQQVGDQRGEEYRLAGAREAGDGQAHAFAPDQRAAEVAGAGERILEGREQGGGQVFRRVRVGCCSLPRLCGGGLSWGDPLA